MHCGLDFVRKYLKYSYNWCDNQNMQFWGLSLR